MHCLAALQRAAILAAALATCGGSSLAETGPATPSKPAQKQTTVLQSTKPPQITDINVTHRASAARAPRQTGPITQLDSDKVDSVKTLINHYAQRHGVPETLAHRIVVRESRYHPGAMGRAHFGLMQLSLPTARQMGYTGTPQGLLDARTNLTFGMPYLANAWMVSGGNEARALSLYSRGYYYDAKRQGLIPSLRQAHSAPVKPADGKTAATAR